MSLSKHNSTTKKTTTPIERDAFHDKEERDALDCRLGAEVRRVRLKKKLTLRDIADATGVSIPYLSDCERGSRYYTASLTRAVARSLEVTVAELLHAAGSCERCGGSGVDPDSDVRIILYMKKTLATASKTKTTNETNGLVLAGVEIKSGH